MNREISMIWVQWKKPTDKSRFIINDKQSEYSADNEDQQKMIGLMSKIGKFKSIISGRNKEKNSSSFSYAYYQSENSIIFHISGNYNECDNYGRNLVYNFFTSCQDNQDHLRVLQAYSDQLGVTINPNDLKKIEEYCNKVNNLKKKEINRLIVIICVIIICLLLFILLSVKN